MLNEDSAHLQGVSDFTSKLRQQDSPLTVLSEFHISKPGSMPAADIMKPSEGVQWCQSWNFKKTQQRPH